MPQVSPNFNLYVLKPNLVKEWHPTKNAGLKPREVTPGSGKKVWWICSNSHEWEAAIYGRSRGRGCPYCKNSTPAIDSRVAVSSSELKMEWHPTANRNLTPAKVTIDNPDKVWWLCREGHEWQATFKSRIKGRSCPICDRRRDKDIQSPSRTGIFDGTAAKTTEFIQEKALLYKIFSADFQKKGRYRSRTSVTLEVPSSKHLLYAHMKDISQEGMGLETSTALTPGTKVNIRLDRSVPGSSQESYGSVIRWCKDLKNEQGTVQNFGLGVQFI